jgi:hypothetical protein
MNHGGIEKSERAKVGRLFRVLSHALEMMPEPDHLGENFARRARERRRHGSIEIEAEVVSPRLIENGK